MKPCIDYIKTPNPLDICMYMSLYYHNMNNGDRQQLLIKGMTHVSSNHDHISSYLQDFPWLPLSYRITYKVLFLTYKALNDEGPPYLK